MRDITLPDCTEGFKILDKIRTSILKVENTGRPILGLCLTLPEITELAKVMGMANVAVDVATLQIMGYPVLCTGANWENPELNAPLAGTVIVENPEQPHFLVAYMFFKINRRLPEKVFVGEGVYDVSVETTFPVVTVKGMPRGQAVPQ